MDRAFDLFGLGGSGHGEIVTNQNFAVSAVTFRRS
jgi:hypothetical protein